MKKFLSFVLTLALILCIVPIGIVNVGAAYYVDGGKCGASASWTYDSDGNVTINGTGAMYDYTDATAPWAKYYEKDNGSPSYVKKVTVNSSISSIGAHAFENATNLSSLSFNSSVTEIGDYAFASNGALTSISLGSTILKIGDYAFAYSAKSTSVSFYATEVGDYAFAYSNKLAKATINSTSDVNYGEGVFSECGVFITYYDKNSNTAVFGNNMFANCGYLTFFAAKRSITEDYANKNKFNYCPLTGYCGEELIWTLDPSGNTLKIDGEGDMYDYDAYGSNAAPWAAAASYPKSVTFGLDSTITHIGSYAFYGCSNLATVNIYCEKVSSIGEGAFDGCKAADKMTFNSYDISYGTYYVHQYADSYSFKYNTIGYLLDGDCGAQGNNITWKLNTYTSSGKLVLSGEGDMADYNSAEEVPWYGNEGSYAATVKTIELAEESQIKHIGNYSFDACSGLTTVYVYSDALESIGDYAFYHCVPISAIYIYSDIVSNISDTAFYNWKGSAKMYGYDGSYVQNYAEGHSFAFSSVGAITAGNCGKGEGDNVTWSLSTYSGTLKIYGTGEMMNFNLNADDPALVPWYSNRTNIKKVIIGEEVINIGDYAFYGCSNLTELKINGAISSVGKYAFALCTSLADLPIKTGVSSIGDYCFYGCTELGTFDGSLSIPSSVKSIGQCAFYYCTGIEELTIPAATETIGDFAFEYCKKLSVVTLNRGVKTIGRRAFYLCPSISIATIPGTVSSLGEMAVGFDYNGKYTPVAGFIIYGVTGTEAERYAKDSNISFSAADLDQSFGDVNNDGDVNVVDAMMTQRYIAGWYDDADCAVDYDVENADVYRLSTGYGIVNSADSIVMARHLAKWKTYDVIPYAGL